MEKRGKYEGKGKKKYEENNRKEKGNRLRKICGKG